MHDTVINLLDEVKQLWMATDSLKAFTDWPDDLIASNSAPNHAPAAEKIMAWRPPENSETSPPGSCGSASNISCKLAIYLYRRRSWPAFS
tara:strand:+ start:125 stop:394 length:270 start_codon:yes stop_codon:yes gene_type:complete